MKRMHIHVAVDNIERSIVFYNALFGQEPTKIKDDYAKWMLNDPRVNFAISNHNEKLGVNHLGLQVDAAEELTAVRGRMKKADMAMFDEGKTECCYAQSDKSWVQDPAGIPWEAFQTMAEAEFYSDHQANSQESSCCTPESKGQAGCCIPSEKTLGCCA